MNSEVRLRSASAPGVIMRDTWLHLLAGGVGGMTGAVVTSPLEVVKTRLQSSGGHSLRLSVSSSRSVSTAAARAGLSEGLVSYSR